ncbi:hypothetical protein ILT44_30400 [Microvirga sp. BT689]|nr:hypothetical protein [Microvirga arvi]
MNQHRLPLNVAFQIESMDAIKGLIADGMACGVLPLGTVMREVRAGTLIARRIVNPPLKRTLFLLQPSTRLQTEARREAQETIERSVSRLAQSFAFESVG